jgi:hypothetical protein
MGADMHQPRGENGQFVSLETILNDRQRAHEQLHMVEKEQLREARRIVDDRLNQMNEFRAALEDQAGRMVSRELYDTLAEKVSELARKQAYWAGGAAVGGFLLSTLLRLLGVTVGPTP